MALEADVASLTTEAGTFDSIAGSLTGVRGHVETIAAAAQQNMSSPAAGVALQQALMKYHEASDQQIRLLSDISENIHTSGIQYDTTDVDNSSNLTTAMGSVLQSTTPRRDHNKEKSMDAGIKYNFAGIEADAGDIHGVVGQVNGLLAEGQGALTRLQATWTGEGQMSYEAVQQRWNQNSEELNLALQNLGQAVGNAGQDMGVTEQGVTSKFT